MEEGSTGGHVGWVDQICSLVLDPFSSTTQSVVSWLHRNETCSQHHIYISIPSWHYIAPLPSIRQMCWTIFIAFNDSLVYFIASFQILIDNIIENFLFLTFEYFTLYTLIGTTCLQVFNK